jgi:hypothetical protein
MLQRNIEQIYPAKFTNKTPIYQQVKMQKKYH